MKIHIVQKGDSLWKIAEKYGVDFEEVKKLNTQLSNPDLIMPGMKIKVPSGGVPVRKEPTGQGPASQASPKHEHPYSKEKPKSVVDIEDTKPKEKQSVPYVPPMPQQHEDGYPEADTNDYYNINQLFQPWSPPKPEEPEKYHFENTENEHYQQDQFPHQEAMNNMENANYPNMPNMPKAPDVGGLEEENIHHAVPNMPGPEPYYHHHPVHFAPCPVPISPVLPGSGLCYPCYPAPHAYPVHQPYGYQPGFVSPAGYGHGGYENKHHENDDHHHYAQHHYPSYGAPYAPQYGAHAYGAPYGQMPYAPHYGGHMGGYGGPQAQSPYHYQPNVAHGYENAPQFKDHDDCGCDDDQHYPYPQGPGYPGAGAYGAPQMPYGGANPYGAGAFGPNQPAPNQMFGRPDEEED
ncbi:peptigoglycan-binding protein LysM [Bacillus atrophaeus]|uniref:spore coat assembly protein SafA n=1 Tax=Bacillus atrophaeus TaxID=1452 RepID=UPI000D03628B|nr:spore coat assembly protein SafA [Bacillus atrophaeus]PRS02477.1 peptigoglycan-binding protein LysM [Bacillus atrophaeus]